MSNKRSKKQNTFDRFELQSQVDDDDDLQDRGWTTTALPCAGSWLVRSPSVFGARHPTHWHGNGHADGRQRAAYASLEGAGARCERRTRQTALDHWDYRLSVACPM